MTPTERYWAYQELVVGLLIAGLCGLCTLNVALAPANRMISPLAWIFGGTPTLVGLWFAGRSIVRLSIANRGKDD